MSILSSKPLAIALGALLAGAALSQSVLAQDSGTPSSGVQDKSMAQSHMMKHQGMWAAMDTDNDGYISKSEHAAYMDSMFTKADTNKMGSSARKKWRRQ